jgi:DnaJ-class molecular chaperone
MALTNNDAYIDNDIATFFKGNYNTDVCIINNTQSPTRKENNANVLAYDIPKYEDLDIYAAINISLIECYTGCVKEYSIERKTYVNNIVVKKCTETGCINIQPGIFNNERIIINDKGHEQRICIKPTTTSDETKTGKLIITVHIADKLYITHLTKYFNLRQDIIDSYNISKQDYFMKHQNNLILIKHINLKEALCGYTFSIPHIDKKIYKIHSTKGTIVYNNKIQTITSHGFKRNSVSGDLLIIYKVVFPEILTEKQQYILDKIL